MIILEEFKEKNINQLISWIQDEKLLFTWAGPGYIFPLTEDQIKSDVEEARRDKNKILFSIVNTEVDETIGHIQLLKIDNEQKTAIIGRILIGNLDNRNKGLGLIAIQQLLKKCFSELKLEKVYLLVFDYNKSAIACYKKAGFQVENIFKNSRTYKGESLTLICMEINKNDFIEHDYKESN